MKRKKKLTQERLKELLHYEPETGVWTWKINGNNQFVKNGARAGCVFESGYRLIMVDGKRYLSSRLAYFYMEGYFPENIMDHINRVTDDDRWDNLRHTSIQCNNRNCSMLKNNTSGIKGVGWHKGAKKFSVGIRINKKQIHIGYFDGKKEAAIARLKAEIKYGFNICDKSSSAYQYIKSQGLDLTKF